MSRKDRGLEYIGGYCYAKKLKDGKYSLYEGCWGRGENNTTGLEVVRDNSGKPLRFDSIEEIAKYKRAKGK